MGWGRFAFRQEVDLGKAFGRFFFRDQSLVILDVRTSRLDQSTSFCKIMASQIMC